MKSCEDAKSACFTLLVWLLLVKASECDSQSGCSMLTAAYKRSSGADSVNGCRFLSSGFSSPGMLRQTVARRGRSDLGAEVTRFSRDLATEDPSIQAICYSLKSLYTGLAIQVTSIDGITYAAAAESDVPCTDPSVTMRRSLAKRSPTSASAIVPVTVSGQDPSLGTTGMNSWHGNNVVSQGGRWVTRRGTNSTRGSGITSFNALKRLATRASGSAGHSTYNS